MTDFFPGIDIDKMINNLRSAGSPYGINFNSYELMCNSRLALEVSEYAKDNGKFDLLHELIFKAYFLEGKDIGKLETILHVSEQAGLNIIELQNQLQGNTYNNRLAQARDLASIFKVAGLPTYIINDDKKIVGAQRYEVFVRSIKEVLDQG